MVAYFSGNEAFGLGNYEYDREWRRNTGCIESLKKRLPENAKPAYALRRPRLVAVAVLFLGKFAFFH